MYQCYKYPSVRPNDKKKIWPYTKYLINNCTDLYYITTMVLVLHLIDFNENVIKISDNLTVFIIIIKLDRYYLYLPDKNKFY